MSHHPPIRKSDQSELAYLVALNVGGQNDRVGLDFTEVWPTVVPQGELVLVVGHNARNVSEECRKNGPQERKHKHCLRLK